MVSVGFCAAGSAILEAPFNGLWTLFLYFARVSANEDGGFQLVGNDINFGLRKSIEVV